MEAGKLWRYNGFPMPQIEPICVYQFKVVPRGISPLIWRRLHLRSDQTIGDLHYAIQIAMGWSDSHLNRFHIHGKDFGVAHIGGIGFSDDPAKVSLGSFRFRIRERFLYEYNFYDNWEHEIRLEKVLPLSPKHLYPVCVGGERPAPPEDCGGAQVYMEEGDPRWRQWSEDLPRKELRLIADTLERLLNSGEGDGSVLGDGKKLLAAVGLVKEYSRRRPDRLDRNAVNKRLRQYARGDREWLFCEIIGG